MAALLVTPLRISLQKGQLVDLGNRPAYCPVARCSRVMVTLVNRKRLPSIGDLTSSHASSGAKKGQKNQTGPKIGSHRPIDNFLPFLNPPSRGQADSSQQFEVTF